MRERSTWQTEKGETPRQAATQRRADIYTMNQEHPQPAATDYESGNPDTWAESWHDYGQVSEEYEGDHVKRNELNFGEFRDDTWKHKDSDNWHSGKGNYDNVKHGEGKFENQSGKSSGEAKTAAERKAIFAERVARAILRTADDKLVTETALDLMALPAKNLVSTLKRMDAVSPDALPEDAKYRRAYACTKLAARLLGDGVKESYVESLASTFMSLDDPTLKAILKTVAAAASRTAQEEEEEEQQSKGKTSQQQEQEEEEQKGHTSQQQEQEEEQQQKTSQQQEQEEEQEQKVSQQEQQQQQSQQQQGQQEQQSQEQQQAHGLSPEEMAMLDQMLHEEMGEHGMPGAPAPAAPGGDTLVELFEAAPAPAVPAAPMMASGKGLDISFDDGDEEMPATHTASTASSLDDLFADDPEVQAQRELQTASAAAASNFASRTASSKGAKKLGAVRPAKPAALEDKLSALWPRPGE